MFTNAEMLAKAHIKFGYVGMTYNAERSQWIWQANFTICEKSLASKWYNGQHGATRLYHVDREMVVIELDK